MDHRLAAEHRGDGGTVCAMQHHGQHRRRTATRSVRLELLELRGCRLATCVEDGGSQPEASRELLANPAQQPQCR